MNSGPKKTPEEFVDALMNDEDFRQRVEADPEHVIRTELDHPHAEKMPTELMPDKGISLPSPDRMKPVVDAMKENQFFPGHGHDLATVLCMVQPAFPLVVGG
jgi:hypothetical protein